ncbi:MAG: pyridoxal phosphate-dependent aminotransferase [Chloroflexaceae bacterium]|nr:pyridoxal phosphate-dependent aminotransferase [Chloroflexaceae bacterium]
MPGCFTNLDLSTNCIEATRRQLAATSGYLDLTSSNPTHQSLLFPPDILQQAADVYWQERCYRPDPRGLLAARHAIARYYATRHPPLDITEDAIYLTASTSEAYSLLFALLTDPGDNVLGPNVSYPLFEYLTAMHYLELRSYLLAESRGWQIDGLSLLAQVDSRSRAVLLVSPHNPTGAIIREPVPELSELGLPIIADEVFAPFVPAGHHVPPLATLHPELPVFHLNGISKMFALPDLKLGWIALNEPAQAQYGPRLEVLNDTLLGANGLVQTMLPTLFAQSTPFVQTMLAQVQTNMQLAQEQLSQCSLLDFHLPDGGYYLFPRVHRWHSEEELVLALLQQGVFVHPGYFYGAVPGSHIMLSALTTNHVFAQGVARLCTALAQPCSVDRSCIMGKQSI